MGAASIVLADPKAETLDIEVLRQRFEAHGQGHVFEFWDQLGPEARDALARQATRLVASLPLLIEQRQAAVEGLGAGSELGPITPGEAIPLPEHGGDLARVDAARRRGLDLLGAGRVGLCVVAGGQGTRLGFDGPKGAFPVGPVSERSLFALQAQKIRGLCRRSGHSIPWYIMTSEATDEATRAIFDAEACFGLAPESVRIFTQGMLPAWDFQGRLILENPHRIAESPDGHGGTLMALDNSGILADMEARGVDRLFYYQVDNPMICLGDPVFLGFHEEAQAEMSCKVIRKIDPDEKVGVLAQVAGSPSVIEYTEFSAELREARDPDGGLVHWAGNIGIHVFNLDFLRRMARESARLLPVHASPKRIQSMNSQSNLRASDGANGYKLERFVFDALPWAKRTCVVEVRATEEFSPIKNATGKDSPESCRTELVGCYRTWLEAAGMAPPPGTNGIEIDHSVIDSAEEAAEKGFANLADAGEAILISTRPTGREI
ncbi:MAG TPA: UDPGP type 1 family protein [Myxococcales bacterium]|nr:UDPGP type 1 family protein [Myxococcales bacterium]HIL02531.1 UDPGP type 1 family protein [Myxococcales bacterium]